MFEPQPLLDVFARVRRQLCPPRDVAIRPGGHDWPLSVPQLREYFVDVLAGHAPQRAKRRLSLFITFLVSSCGTWEAVFNRVSEVVQGCTHDLRDAHATLTATRESDELAGCL